MGNADVRIPSEILDRLTTFEGPLVQYVVIDEPRSRCRLGRWVTIGCKFRAEKPASESPHFSNSGLSSENAAVRAPLTPYAAIQE